MTDFIKQLPKDAPKEALPFLADLFHSAWADSGDLNEDTQALLNWADEQTTRAQMKALEKALESDCHPKAMNFVYLDSWRFPYGSFNASTGCQWARHSFQEWLEVGAFNEPAWTWRALKGLQFGTNPISLQSLLPPALRDLLMVSPAGELPRRKS
ncbi:hypothetical protein C4E44_04560 [Pseudomonas sp. MWU12-2312b]|nr:hypothetical protein C4E44_04560 [Pseudomonas sp. MWU12-2312b]